MYILQAALLIYKLLALSVFTDFPFWEFFEPFLNISWWIILVPSYFIIGKALAGFIMKKNRLKGQKKKQNL
ncbi:MAG: hypothetical protein ABSA17_06585 [Rhabdochlamydiaceae bacterium]|jgi:hypothetical protein